MAAPLPFITSTIVPDAPPESPEIATFSDEESALFDFTVAFPLLNLFYDRDKLPKIFFEGRLQFFPADIEYEPCGQKYPIAPLPARLSYIPLRSPPT